MPAFTIRRAGVTEAAAISALAARTFALACPPSTAPEDIAAHVRTCLSAEVLQHELSRADTTYYVAQTDGGFVGFAMLVAGAEPPAGGPGHRPIELKRIYVDESWHGTGVAGALMAECVRHARSGGHDLIWLGTNVGNRRALTFYRRSGFEVAGTRTFTVGGSVENDHVLVRALAD